MKRISGVIAEAAKEGLQRLDLFGSELVEQPFRGVDGLLCKELL